MSRRVGREVSKLSKFRVVEVEIVDPGGPLPQRSIEAMVEFLAILGEEDKDWPLQVEKSL